MSDDFRHSLHHFEVFCVCFGSFLIELLCLLILYSYFYHLFWYLTLTFRHFTETLLILFHLLSYYSYTLWYFYISSKKNCRANCWIWPGQLLIQQFVRLIQQFARLIQQFVRLTTTCSVNSTVGPVTLLTTKQRETKRIEDPSKRRAKMSHKTECPYTIRFFKPQKHKLA